MRTVMKLRIGILAALFTVVNCLPRDRFFPFGVRAGDEKLRRGSSHPVDLTFRDRFTFLGEEQSTLHIARDGFVSFSSSSRDSKIAPFNAKLKMPRKQGFVWYRTTVSAEVEERILTIIQQNFRNLGSLDVSSFRPSSFVIVTWESMAVRDRSHEVIGRVTFQLVLVADTTHSFAFFLYDDKNQYPRPDRIGEFINAGFTSGRHPDRWEFEMVYPDGTSKAAALFEAMRDSNVGVNGMWAYQIDGRMDGNIISAVSYVPFEERPQADSPPGVDMDLQLDAANTFDVEVLAFEDQCTRSTCSVNGRCVQYPTGHCCGCNDGFTGNGIHCIPNTSSDNQRMNARVSGTINGFQIPDDVDLHTFIVTTAGRTFTAISPISVEAAYTMQLLLPIGELMGWLFAQPAAKGINGFMQTGADLTYRATITFENGETVTVVQQFNGVDEEGNIDGTVTIDGNMPILPEGSSVEVESHSEVYTKYRPGYVYSSEDRYLRVGDDRIRFAVEQVITFQECEADDIDTDASLTAMRMNTTFAYSLYEPNGEILRYAMITSVGPDAGVPTDPCRGNNCDVNANCLPQGTSFTCQCGSGFTGDGFTCVEGAIDPCENNDCDQHADCNQASETSYYCQCAPGYQGDGRTCTPEDPCENNDCSRFAYCYPDSEGGHYCECARGYTGDGQTCTREEQVEPCLNNRCDANAECRPVEGGYTCSCNAGYQGDGYTCQLPDQLVSTCSDCSTEASCLPEGRGYRCLCRAGFQGNGIICEDVNECVEGAEIACDANAHCYNNLGSYTCYCMAGFRGDGFTCEAPPEAEGSLVFGQGMSVMHMPLDSSQRGGKVFMRARQTVVGVGYDCGEDQVYWTDVSGRSIMRSSLDGRDAAVVVNTSLSSPEGIAIDHLSRNMYWTDSGYDRIEVANLDGRNRHVLFDDDMVNPRAIAVDPVGGYLYWADWNRNGPKIERAHMDGTNRETLVNGSLVLPNGLTIDSVSRLLCWADAGTHKLECINLNGDPQTRYTVYNGTQYSFGLASLGYNLYWTDWRTTDIQSVNKNGGQRSQSHPLPRGGNGKVYGIAAVAPCPAGNNRCASQNGGCTNLCLPTPGAQATCTCPNSLAPNEIPCN